MIRLHPVWAFVVTALVMTMVLGGVMVGMIISMRAEDPDTLGQWIWPDLSLIFAASFLYVAGTGLIVGLPVLFLLRWLRWSERLVALVAAGFVSGVLIVLIRFGWNGGEGLAFALEPALLIGGFGAASGLLWWALTCGARRPSAAVQA